MNEIQQDWKTTVRAAYEDIEKAQKNYIIIVAKRLRDRYNLSIREIADALGVWQNTLETWLQEDEQP